MAIKFDFNKLRSAFLGWMTGTDIAGASLSGGEEAVYIPKLRQAFHVVNIGSAITLTNEDSGKIFAVESSGGAFQVTLPTTAADGVWFRFYGVEETLTADVTIAAGAAIIAGVGKDAAGDVGIGTAGTEVSNVLMDTTGEIGDFVELIGVGGYYMMNAQSSISGGMTTT